MTQKTKYTERQLEQYKLYLQEWEHRYLCEKVVPWGLSNNIGDPFSMREWVEKSYLQNFKGF